MPEININFINKKNMETIKLQRVGRNYNGYTAYKDEQGKFYLDLALAPVSHPTTLYTVCPASDIDGEAGFELDKPFTITNPYTEKDIREYHCRDKYMMLSRIYDDFSAYLGKTGDEEQDKWDCRYHNDKFGLWGNSIEETIEELKRRWNIIPEDLKPQWCTIEDIATLEQRAMTMSL